MHKKNSKRGADKIISVYWFAILFIVAAAIVYMVGAFYGKPYDVREIETDTLMDSVANCVSDAGYLEEEIFEKLEANFLEECHLNFNVEDYCRWDNDQYYVKVNFLDFSSGSDVFSTEVGNKNLKDFCNLEGENFPYCLERSFYVIDEEENQNKYQVNILSIVRKTEKNVQAGC